MSYLPPLAQILRTLRVIADDPAHRATYAGEELETAQAALGVAARLLGETVAPHVALIDREGCALVDGRVQVPDVLAESWRAFVAGGWTGFALPSEVGGQGLPELAQAALSEMTSAASLPLGMLALLGRAAARTLIAHGDATVQPFVPELVAGRWAATIAMTEPEAGSDAGAVRTRATPHGPAYAVSGDKIFISFGDHALAPQIVHLVLARLPDAPAGAAGVSLFAVPALRLEKNGLGARNGVRVLRVEEKLGLHGSPTCALSFDEAEGFLIGRPHQGFRAIFTMVNAMRLEVALQGVGLASAATQAAARYAGARMQGSDGGARVAIVRHPDVRRMLMTMAVLSEGSRALAYEIAGCLDRAERTDDRDASDMAAWLLPIAKAVCGEIAVTCADLAIQVHGGHGYVRDTGVERLLRDARILPIYEGTTGIQAIDLVTRKLPADDSRRFRVFVSRVRIDIARLRAAPGCGGIASALDDAARLLEACSAKLAALLGSAPRDALAGAIPYLALAGRVALGWCWLRLAAAEADGGRWRPLGQFFAHDILADATALAARARAGTGLLDALEDGAFA
jgi:alkylation response protein AidB-like acyl-CoA dehydrogenase